MFCNGKLARKIAILEDRVDYMDRELENAFARIAELERERVQREVKSCIKKPAKKKVGRPRKDIKRVDLAKEK